jgi:hypothetical protein
MPHPTDANLTPKDLQGLTSADALAAFFTSLGYDTSSRKSLTPESIGLSGESAAPVQSIEVLSEDPEGFLRLVCVQLRSLTAKSRNDLARVLGRTNVDHLLVLVSDFETLEFVLLDKRRRESRGPTDTRRIQVVPLSLAIARKSVGTRQLRTIRRLTWTSRDGLEQFDKLRSVFEAAAFSEDYFCNRALFADHYLLTRLREDPAWRDNPTEVFRTVKQLLADARRRWLEKGEALVREQLFEPIFKLLGFEARVNKSAGDPHTKPDYILSGHGSTTAAFVYAWDRWLDGPDFILDQHTPEENPGACVVSALNEGVADWIIMTNGRQWRLYSRNAHSRATNFYEVDVLEALIASGDTDPNEAFRYWWLFFRAEAVAPLAGQPQTCWLDSVATGSREYAKQLGERLKQRIFETIFPHLSQGFLEDRRRRLGIKCKPTEDELQAAFEATLTLLYRLLFLLYAESRDLLPIREAPYRAASLTKVKEDIAERAGIAETEAAVRLFKAYSVTETTLYDRLLRLCEAMDRGDPSLNVPIYNGGLFVTRPDDSDAREQRIGRFLSEHKVPDRFLAIAIDLLARDPDDRTLSLGFIDYKSLEVRHLGSIYEGLLEFKLRIASEDLTTKTDKGKEKLIPLTEARSRRGRSPEPVVRRGDVYLSNDNAERKASGSYYTPDKIVEYIVEHTVGPVLDEKLESLRGDLRKVRKTFDNELAKLEVPPVPEPVRSGAMTARDFAADKTYEVHCDLVDRLFEFRTLDPAMGSGHFLVEAVDFITDRLLTFLNQFPVNPVGFMLDRTRRNILEALGEQGVAVDPDKLTEVNLLKRHVLKRCIYGVDLNPMAVELAKVSLWLDAFTIGAPLSFLDHHLRYGNSLVGATFHDLEAATRGQLFSIDYEPLLRAVRHVIQVNQMADATATEAKRSASEYGRAREEHSGYKIVLDFLVAKYFGEPQAAGLLTQGADLDLSSRDHFLESFADDGERELVAEVEALARKPGMRFFHWEIEFPEVFFRYADADGRRFKHKNEIRSGSAGFDAVVGNPPYDVLAEKEIGVDLEELLGYFRAEPLYAHGLGGKLNLYKLFICRNVPLARKGGGIGNIVPMSLLGDEQAAGVRRMLLTDTSLSRIEAFPQKDDPKNRVFEDAKLSTCVFVTRRANDDSPMKIRVHPGKEILADSPSLSMRRGEPALYDASNEPIFACSQADWDLATKIMASGRMGRLGEYCTAHQGEVNETADTAAGNLSRNRKDGPQVLRGSNVCLYALRPPSQGEAIFLRRERFLYDKRPGSKAWDHRHRRVGFQRKSPQNNFRRLVACLVSRGDFCCDSISYVTDLECRVPLECLIALLNSKLLDWFFRLGSTNAQINDYQLISLPFPGIDSGRPCDADVVRFCDALGRGQYSEAFQAIEDLIAVPPFPATVRECIVHLVNRIIEIEADRGEIARSERSSLSPAAQPHQDLLDRMVYRMAGLSDEEIAGLEDRLARML